MLERRRRRRVALVVGNEPIALNQFKERYYDPGLLAKILGFNKEKLRDVQAFKNVALYPDIELRQPTAENPTLGIKLTSRGGGIGRVVVSLNGKELTRMPVEKTVIPDARTAELSMDLAGHPYLIPGEKNVIEVKAYNAEDISRAGA